MHYEEPMSLSAAMPLVSILVLNYNGKRFLKNLFDSLHQCTYPNLEIIMVDNASHDDSVAFVQANYPKVKIHQNAENYFFARGNNEGIRVASGKYICVLNNDVEVAPGFVEPIVAAFENDAQIAAVQPKILAMQQRDYFEYSGACGGFLDRFGYPFVRGRIFRTIEKDEGQYNQPCRLFWASGACIVLRKSAIDTVGAFDPDFMMHMEEIDLCWRLQLYGWEVVVVPSSKIWHYVGGTLNQDNPRKMYWNYRNNLFMLAKNLSTFNLATRLLFRIPLDVVALTVETLKLRFGNSWAIIKAYLWLILNLPMVFRKRKTVQRLRKVSDLKIFHKMYRGSIVFEYFILGKRKFSELIWVDELVNKNLLPYDIQMQNTLNGEILNDE